MTESKSWERLRDSVINGVDAIICSCEEHHRPLEVEPARGELFELFATAERAGLVTGNDESAGELSTDSLCRILSDRWGLKSTAAKFFQNQASLPTEQLARLRSLWSVLRMWMEWTYAWDRWPDFHKAAPGEGVSESETVASRQS